MIDIARNIQLIQERIEKAAAACGRPAGEIMLLPITKTHPVESISRAIAAGLRRFGENRVQEAESKIRQFSDTGNLEWHLVGHLQSNKARTAAALFDVVHSLDSIKLALKLNEAGLACNKILSVLLQVDLGQEATKFGADVDQVREIVAAVSELKGIKLNGLMTIPPFFDNAEQARPFFMRLRELSSILESEKPGCLGQRHLSMGMSHDFEVAIQEGSTIVRIGTAIFGERQYGRT